MKNKLLKNMCFAALACASAALAQAQTQTVSDGGTQAVAEAQSQAPAPASPKFKDAHKVLEGIALKRKWAQGWDMDKQRIIVINSVSFPCDNPAADKQFFINRDMAAKRAVLEAKAEIIETLNTEMSAFDMLSIPGSDLDKQLGAEWQALEQRALQQREVLAKLREQMDAAEAEALRGATFGDRLNALMDAVIKKLDDTYDKDAVDGRKKAEYAEAKKNYEALKADVEALSKKAEELKAKNKEQQESYVATISKMPLFGATVIMQTESWDNTAAKPVYQVAVMVCWSKALEDAARAIITGSELKAKANNAKSIQDWLSEQDLSTMIGARQYIDDKGDRWFLGVSSRDYSGLPVEQRKNKNVAEMFAKQAAMFCLFGDVESYKMAHSKQNIDADNNIATAENYAAKLSQYFENKTVRGLQKLCGTSFDHPITNSPIYVAVYGINATAAKKALEAERSLVETAVLANRYQTVEKGRNKANADAVEASKNRPEDFQKGYNSQSGAINRGVEQKENFAKPKEQKGVVIINKQTTVRATTVEKKSTSGTFGGDSNVSDDF